MAAPLSPYDSPDDLKSTVLDLSKQTHVELIAYGASVEGRTLEALRFSSPRHDAPRLMLAANIHGIEYIGTHVALKIAQLLSDQSDPNWNSLREQAEIWVFPTLNPDAYAATWLREGEGSLAPLRTNARGVDLNRNFPRPTRQRRRRLPGAGNRRPGTATYIGPSALSEPETRDLIRLCQDVNFHCAANLHSFMGSLIHARVRTRSDWAQYTKLLTAFHRGGPGPRFFRLAHRWFDTFTGELEDCQHHCFGCWATCIELFAWHESLRQSRQFPSSKVFWRFNPRDPNPHAEREEKRILAYFSQSLSLGKPDERFDMPSSYDLRESISAPNYVNAAITSRTSK